MNACHGFVFVISGLCCAGQASWRHLSVGATRMKGVLFVAFCAGLAYVSTFDLISNLPITRKLAKVFR